MNVSENDVKVLGKVVSIAVDGIVADAELVFDKNANLNQETINRNMTNAINQAVADVSSINTRVGSLEDALDDKLNISDYQTYSALMRDSIMLKIGEVEDEKQDVLTFDNTPTDNSDNPVKSGGIKSAIDNITSSIKNSLSTYWIKILYDNNGRDEEKARIDGSYDSFTISTNDHTDFILSALGGNIEAIASGEIVVSSNDNIGITSNGSDHNINITSSADVNVNASRDAFIAATEAMHLNAVNTTINGEETIELTAPSVKINGTNIDTIKNNAQNALNKINAMYPDQFDGMQVKTPGIYYAYPDTSRMPDLIPSSMNHGAFTGYLLLVTTVIEMDIHGGYTYLHQLIIDIVTGRKATRSIQFPSTGDIDWSTAPNFTEV